jgi:hypothetical protein
VSNLGGRSPEKLETDEIDREAAAEYFDGQYMSQRNGRKIWHRSHRMGSKVFWMECGVNCGNPQHSNRPVDGCSHILKPDPVHPVGIKMLPSGLFLCNTCFGLRERLSFKRKDVYVWCYDCVETECIRLRQIDPELFEDLRITEANHDGR